MESTPSVKFRRLVYLHEVAQAKVADFDFIQRVVTEKDVFKLETRGSSGKTVNGKWKGAQRSGMRTISGMSGKQR